MYFWNQPILKNECNVSCSKKQRFAPDLTHAATDPPTRYPLDATLKCHDYMYHDIMLFKVGLIVSDCKREYFLSCNDSL